MAADEVMIPVPVELYERLERIAGASARPVRDLVLDALADLAAGAPRGGEAGGWSDAGRDEVAARLASLGYLDE